MTHNLLTHLEEIIRMRFGLSGQEEFKRRRQRESAKTVTRTDARMSVQRLPQRAVKFNPQVFKGHRDLHRDWDANFGYP